MNETLRIPTLGGSADGVVRLVPANELPPPVARHGDDVYELIFDENHNGMFSARYVVAEAVQDVRARHRPRRMGWHLTALKRPYCELLSLGRDYATAATACGVTYQAMLEERKLDPAFDLLCRFTRAEGKQRR